MRGAVHRLRSDRLARGHEQTGPRYAVVLQASRFDLLSRWIVAPTSTGARSMAVRPDVDWGAGPTSVLCDALAAVDPGVCLGERVGHLTHVEQLQVALHWHCCWILRHQWDSETAHWAIRSRLLIGRAPSQAGGDEQAAGHGTAKGDVPA